MVPKEEFASRLICWRLGVDVTEHNLAKLREEL
jgi:hypothetical protein